MRVTSRGHKEGSLNVERLFPPLERALARVALAVVSAALRPEQVSKKALMHCIVPSSDSLPLYRRFDIYFMWPGFSLGIKVVRGHDATSP